MELQAGMAVADTAADKAVRMAARMAVRTGRLLPPVVAGMGPPVAGALAARLAAGAEVAQLPVEVEEAGLPPVGAVVAVPLPAGVEEEVLPAAALQARPLLLRLHRRP